VPAPQSDGALRLRGVRPGIDVGFMSTSTAQCHLDDGGR